jgi:hypothetical protein
MAQLIRGRLAGHRLVTDRSVRVPKQPSSPAELTLRRADLIAASGLSCARRTWISLRRTAMSAMGTGRHLVYL